MPAAEFQFTIALSGEAPDFQMLTDIVRHVLEHAGLAGDSADRLVQQVRAQLRGEACELQFQGSGGELQVVLTQQGREWRTACPIPPR